MAAKGLKQIDVKSKAVAPKPSNEYEPNKYKVISRSKIAGVYELISGLKLVTITPFHPGLFANAEFCEQVEQAEAYTVHRIKAKDVSVCMLQYKEVEDGENAYYAIRECLAADGVTVEHPKNASKYIEWVFHSARDTGPRGILRHLYLDGDEVDAFHERTAIIEHLPVCESSNLRDMFPEALNMINYTLDTYVRDTAIAELGSKEETTAFVKKYHGVKVDGKPICVNALSARLNKLQEKSRDDGRKLRERINLSDGERLQKVAQFVKLSLEKDSILNSTDMFGFDKEVRYMELESSWDVLSKEIYADARRRFDKGIKLPDNPDDIPQSLHKLVLGKGVFEKIKPKKDVKKKPAEQQNKKIGQLATRTGPPLKRPFQGFGGDFGRNGGPPLKRPFPGFGGDFGRNEGPSPMAPSRAFGNDYARNDGPSPMAPSRGFGSDYARNEGPSPMAPSRGFGNDYARNDGPRPLETFSGYDRGRHSDGYQSPVMRRDFGMGRDAGFSPRGSMGPPRSGMAGQGSRMSDSMTSSRLSGDDTVTIKELADKIMHLEAEIGERKMNQRQGGFHQQGYGDGRRFGGRF